jgi:hypothetical protein
MYLLACPRQGLSLTMNAESEKMKFCPRVVQICWRKSNFERFTNQPFPGCRDQHSIDRGGRHECYCFSYRITQLSLLSSKSWHSTQPLSLAQLEERKTVTELRFPWGIESDNPES